MTELKFDAVLFDLDGTLLDTLEDLGDSMNAVLAARGHPTHALGAYRYAWRICCASCAPPGCG